MAVQNRFLTAIPPLNIENLQLRVWDAPLREALAEDNLGRVHKKVMEAEAAIWFRLQELSNGPHGDAERAVIQRACDLMLKIKTIKLKWPLFD